MKSVGMPEVGVPSAPPPPQAVARMARMLKIEKYSQIFRFIVLLLNLER
jgi:hypothetical protein